MPDRAAIVTGASSGIGLAIARMLGEQGYGITAAARRPEKLSGATGELRSAGVEVEEVAGNMADEAARSSSSTASAQTCSRPRAPSTATPSW
jgi:NADP-dependent 3-hydroxy acid dehydrogenase YdfG